MSSMATAIAIATAHAISKTNTNQLEKKPSDTPKTHRGFWRLRRKRKLPSVRLGGQRQIQEGGSRSVMVRMFKRLRVKWAMKLKKVCILKKLKEYYLCVLRNLTENDRSIDNHQNMLLMETTFATPVMGIQLNSFR